jgi:flagellar motor switch protein FliN/FliY
MSSNPVAIDDFAQDLSALATHSSTSPPATQEGWGSRGHEAVMRIPVSVRFVLGSARMSVSKLMSLTRGSTIPLDRKVGDLVDIVVNDLLVAKGEIVVLDQESDRFAVIVRQVVATSDD